MRWCWADSPVCTLYDSDGSDTGLRTITLLRKLNGTEIPAIVVTAHRTASVVRSCARHGVRVLEKPIRPEDLRDALLRLVGEQT